MARTPGVGRDPGLYDYWFAVIESAKWAEN
jgi:hypothetical protein